MIKKGDKYLCVKDYVMDCGRIDYTKEQLYLSEQKGCITDNEDCKSHFIHNSDLDEYFIKLNEYNTMTYLDEAIADYEVKDSEIVTPKNDPIVSSVMFQLAQRSIVGQQKYGTTLEDNNTDDFLQHLKEELMDAILYIEKLQTLKNN